MTDFPRLRNLLPSRPPNRLARQVCFASLGLLVLALPLQAPAAFGVVSSGGSYTVDTGAGLVFKVNQSNGDITSLVFNGVEYQSSSKRSQIASGLGSATVTATTYGNDYIKISIATSPSNSVVTSLTQYLMAKNGDPIIYMATYVTAEPNVGELRWITRLKSSLLPNGPVPSEIRNTAGAIESSDVFGLSDGTTRSKYYGDSSSHGKDRAMDLTYCGATGTGVGVWMVYDNPRESSSGGPFYRDIQNQGGSDQEVYNYMNSGHNQTDIWRNHVLYGPYALVFTTGAPPALPLDYSWIETGGLNLTGWVSRIYRGAVKGVVSGIPAGFQGVVGFANSAAQYWATVSSSGNYLTPLMKPGTYNVTLYKGELEVATSSTTVSAGQTNLLNLESTETMATSILRIGEWDGTPNGFLNANKIIQMHPSDVRMDDWAPVTFTIGSDSDSAFPMACWKDVNNPTTIHFNLTQSQIQNLTLRVGITCAYAGGRPKPGIGSWTPSNPSPSSQPKSRSLTVGTYRGNNTLYTFTVPSSAFVAGQNTLTLTVISGSSGSGFLSPGCAYDAVELSVPNSNPLPPSGPLALTAAYASGSQINLTWTDTSTSEINFLVERSTDDVTFKLIGAVTAGITHFADTDVSPTGTFYYRVRASNSGGKSSYSNVASAVAPNIASAIPNGGSLELSGGGGTPSGVYYLLAATSPSLPLEQWTRIATNHFDALGNFTETNAFDTLAPQQFYRIEIP